MCMFSKPSTPKVTPAPAPPPPPEDTTAEDTATARRRKAAQQAELERQKAAASTVQTEPGGLGSADSAMVRRKKLG